MLNIAGANQTSVKGMILSYLCSFISLLILLYFDTFTVETKQLFLIYNLFILPCENH